MVCDTVASPLRRIRTADEPTDWLGAGTSLAASTRSTRFERGRVQSMKRARRWLIASLAGVVAFLLVWWGLAAGGHWSRGDAIGLAAVALAVVIAPLGWWAALPLQADGGWDGSPGHSADPLTVVKQKARAKGHARITQAGGDVILQHPRDRRSVDDQGADR